MIEVSTNIEMLKEVFFLIKMHIELQEKFHACGKLHTIFMCTL